MDDLDALIARLPVGDPAQEGHPDLATMVRYRLGSLPTEAQEALELHLVECSACRRSFVDLATPVGADMQGIVLARMQSASRASWKVPACSALAVVALAASVALLVLPSPESPRSTPTHVVEGFQGLSPVKGSGAKPVARIELRPDTPLDVVVRPIEDVAPKARLTVLAGRSGGPLAVVLSPSIAPEGIEFASSESGAIRLRGPAGALLREGPGGYDVVFLLEPGEASCVGSLEFPLVDVRRACAAAMMWHEHVVWLR